MNQSSFDRFICSYKLNCSVIIESFRKPISVDCKMPEIELESLVWLVWGGSLVGLQSSISISLNFQKKTSLPIIGSAYFLSILCLSFFLPKELLLFYKILAILLIFGISASLILVYQMIRRKNWCGICIRVHFANLVLLVTLIEAWPKLNFFS